MRLLFRNMIFNEKKTDFVDKRVGLEVLLNYKNAYFIIVFAKG